MSYYCGFIIHPEKIPTNNFGNLPRYEDYMCHTWWPTKEERDAHMRTHTEVTYAMVTGHGELKYESVVKQALTDTLIGVKATYNKVVGVSGGAPGADRIWALSNYEMDNPFIVVVPTGYEWPFIKKDSRHGYRMRPNWEQVMEKWYKMLDLALEVRDEHGKPRPKRTPDESYKKGANFTRNHTMVDMSQVHIVVSEEHPMHYVNNIGVRGGTAECVRYMYKSANVGAIYWIDASKSIPVVTLISNFGKEK